MKFGIVPRKEKDCNGKKKTTDWKNKEKVKLTILIFWK